MPFMGKTDDGYSELSTIVNSSGTEIDYVLSKTNDGYKRTFTKLRELTGEVPLSYKGITPAPDLTNYRIYGNTVDSESVGDRTGNLFESELVNYNIESDGKIYTNTEFILSIAPVIAGTTYTISNNLSTNVYAFYQQYPKYESYSYDNSRYIFTKNSITIVAPIDGYIVVRKVASHPPIMLNSGSEALPYEPYGYRVPVTINDVTTNLYLPEQIKMVGDEAEYIDYGEQKQHRVRKNLLPNNGTSIVSENLAIVKNDDGSVSFTNNGERQLVTWSYYDSNTPIFEAGMPIIISTESNIGISFRYNDNTWSGTTPLNSRFVLPNSVKMVYTQFYLDAGISTTVYPMIRKADIEDDTYEPYITNTDLDVTLPALPTIAGTNTLSVGTEVLPSSVYLKGAIKALPSGGDT